MVVTSLPKETMVYAGLHGILLTFIFSPILLKKECAESLLLGRRNLLRKGTPAGSS